MVRKEIKYYIDDNGCYICTSHTSRYPRFARHGVLMQIGRYMVYKKTGVFPIWEVMRHKCDNKKCINPDHIIGGSWQDNANDMVSRGRSCKGSKNGNSKLTEEIVKEIKKSKLSSRKTAEKFNISQKTIMNIRHGKIWKHVK